MKLLKKISLWLKKQSYLVEMIVERETTLGTEFRNILAKIKQLDTDKVHWLVVPRGDARKTVEMIKATTKTMNEVLPHIIISTEELEELDEKKLKALLKKVRAWKKKKK